MSEKTQRQRVVKALRVLDAISVENSAYPGTPDLNFIGGWIELKWARRWPKEKITIFRMEHFTPQQRVWLTRRWRRGGGAWVLLQVGLTWLLFDGPTAAQILGRVNEETLRSKAVKVWERGLNDKELRECLTSAPHAQRDC